MSTRKTSGKVYLVGAGPGAPDLLTIRATRLLARADVVFYDALVAASIIDLATRAEKIAVGKRCGRHSTAQRFINKRLVDAAQRHTVVVRLKGGDPMMFGRAQEEIDALQKAGIACEVVPGVTSALAASAELGISLTRRGISRAVTFVTPRSAPGKAGSNWVRSVCAADTAAVYMAGGEAASIASTLIANGLAPEVPVIVVEDATLPSMKKTSMTLAELQASSSSVTHGGPALILIGEVFGQDISTRTIDRSDELSLPAPAASLCA